MKSALLSIVMAFPILINLNLDQLTIYNIFVAIALWVYGVWLCW